MTPVQWLFHYTEICKLKEEKVNSDIEVLKSFINFFNGNTKALMDTIIDGAKISGSMANPDAGKALLDAEKLKEARADIGDDEFCDWWEDFSARIPSNLKVEDMGDHVDLEGDAINLEKLYEIEMKSREEMIKE